MDRHSAIQAFRRLAIGAALSAGAIYEAFALTNCADMIPGPPYQCTQNGTEVRTCCIGGTPDTCSKESCTVERWEKNAGSGVFWKNATSCFNPGVSCTPVQRSCT